jgi:alkaline phosphatase D
MAMAAGGCLAPVKAFVTDPFALGVASGDPLSDAVVLWTRLMVGAEAAPIPVQWEVGRDEQLHTVVARGEVIARGESAHCVHVDVRGLEARRPYWYRFRVGRGGNAVESPIGRTLTAPRPGAALSSYRFAFASCQKYEDGFYTAWRHLASEDLELVLFLGDYIYQGAAKVGMPRPHPKHEAMTLDDYRERYALYRSDPDLQLAHARFPWLVVWDDHELCNDYAGEAIERDPTQRARRDAAYRAFFEHMPLRGGSRRPLYRSLDLGMLARLSLLDTRRYKSPLACGEGVKVACAEMSREDRTMLGAVQERWLRGNLTQSRAAWQILAQQVPFARVDRQPGPEVRLHMDKWDGYPAARERLLEVLARRAKGDAVVLTGDNHNAWVMDLAQESGQKVGTEFVATSISSTGDGSEQRKEYAAVLSDNPHARYLNSRRGYTSCSVTPEEWVTDFMAVPWVTRPGAGVRRAARFVLRRGSMAVERAG